ncbi:uncharacterized protein SPAPADRAFT_64434 [Spathaspora passalidarum NRRL Y-27907]|uniref:Agglutinin-like protein N-terminal domain-containing protein n=1 Tax=Spathaspora passalidarum (strain NRRL Y-27907 / 11-Y1) TaxID=619300 RepID=G3AGE5_SPAPN|nr:uncharacterized protein SPAPADRAFT_64434 [Spathaspora passalidarum NRRL Y-27907]EGW35284.1 hypothetical protein SPAPADRAFT_64434 [Spathaspora passalidarum NRRL Y-27907]QTC09996.1 agglutinin-like protein [Spathaspora passalidarum]
MYLLLILLQLLTFAATQEISGVFTSFNSLTWLNSNPNTFQTPASPAWIAELSWKIDGSVVSAGDTFSLTMPCVFRFYTDQDSVNLRVGSTNYATCDFITGGISSTDSELNCVLSDEVEESILAVGKLTFPIVFNIGRSTEDVDLYCSTFYQGGLNTISFMDGDNTLSIDVEFQDGTPSGDPNGPMYGARMLPSSNRWQNYVLGGLCPGGLSTATIGITINDDVSTIDCETANIRLTNAVNDWFYPESFKTFTTASKLCRSNSFMITYWGVPDGYRVFIEAVINTDGNPPRVQYTNKYLCPTTIDNGVWVNWLPYDSVEADGPGKEIITVTETWTGSDTETITKSFDEDEDLTITIAVNIPIPTITLTETYVGITTSYTTYTVEPGETASVVVYDPVHTTITEESCWESDESITTTIIDPDWASDTILIVTPCEVTSTEQEESSTKVEDIPSDDTLDDDSYNPPEIADNASSEEITSGEVQSTEILSSEEVQSTEILSSEEVQSTEILSSEESFSQDSTTVPYGSTKETEISTEIVLEETFSTEDTTPENNTWDGLTDDDSQQPSSNTKNDSNEEYTSDQIDISSSGSETSAKQTTTETIPDNHTTDIVQEDPGTEILSVENTTVRVPDDNTTDISPSDVICNSENEASSEPNETRTYVSIVPTTKSKDSTITSAFSGYEQDTITKVITYTTTICESDTVTQVITYTTIITNHDSIAKTATEMTTEATSFAVTTVGETRTIIYLQDSMGTTNDTGNNSSNTKSDSRTASNNTGNNSSNTKSYSGTASNEEIQTTANSENNSEHTKSESGQSDISEYYSGGTESDSGKGNKSVVPEENQGTNSRNNNSSTNSNNRSDDQTTRGSYSTSLQLVTSNGIGSTRGTSTFSLLFTFVIAILY